MEDRNNHRHHSSQRCLWAKGAIIDIMHFSFLWEICFWEKQTIVGTILLGGWVENRSRYRHHSSEECLWAKEANKGTIPLGSVCGKQGNHRHHSSEESWWEKGTRIDIIALRNMFMGKANHCRDHSSGECLWKTGTIIDITPLSGVYGQMEPL